ncbi:uncharacterized protein [Venturia canescens]|uniref:uncharacterized protein n=1 Tax=Venturia canescens TaxID=32260 RepID=UPI001C9BBE68|nr:uncharacterized protein LOC122413128 [Venturia canescens]
MKNPEVQTTHQIPRTFPEERIPVLFYQQVPTGRFHITKNNERHSDITTGIVFGAVHAGIGCSTLNKLLACADIPTITDSLFKRYEREMGPMIEEAAKESCKRAAAEERELVLEKMVQLAQEL